MQILHLLQKLLHFSVFYNGLVLVLASKRCLPLFSDGTDMLLIFILFACLYSGNFQALPARKLCMGGGWKKFPAVRIITNYTNNCILLLSSIAFNVSLPALMVHYSLSANGSCSPGATSGGLQTAAAGFLYIFGFTEFTEEKNEYYKEENVHRTG